MAEYVKMNHVDCVYEPDGDRVLYDPKYCDGHYCPVDCYRCPIGAEIEEENAAEYDDEDVEVPHDG